MKPNHPLLLTLALSSAILVTACDRDRDETPAGVAADQPAAAVEPSPAPMPTQETMAPAPPAAAVDSGMPFNVMDKNADGGITQDELAPTEMLHQHFIQADTDGDGKLSEAEVDKHRAEMGG